MKQLSNVMSCLYDCIYTSLKYKSYQDAFEAIVCPLGFSIEANIRSRSWVLCGQSDVDYYKPKLNRGFEVNWEESSLQDILHRLNYLHTQDFPLLVETHSESIPYYRPGSLEIGMPHTFIIYSYEKNNKEIKAYDKLASRRYIAKDRDNCIITNLDVLLPALEKKIFVANISHTPPSTTWDQELHNILKASVENMTLKVDRKSLNYQIFGLQALEYFADTIGNFSPHYQDDTQSLWLMSYYLPASLFQSVYGNRFILSKALSKSLNQYPNYKMINDALLASMENWKLLRKGFINCSQSIIPYSEVAHQILKVFQSEKELVNQIQNTI
jgi:hypothetical protein